MTDLDSMSALAWLLCAVGTVGGFAVGAWRRERTLDRAYEEGERNAADWYEEILATLDPVRDVPPAAGRELGDDGGGEGASGVLAGGGPHPRQLENVPRPGAKPAVMPPEGARGGWQSDPMGEPGPGHRGYGPYLAAIGRDDPAGWYANLAAGEPAPEPGPAPEPAWVERLLHQGAISTAWCEATLHDTAEYFRADEAAVDCQIEQWVKAARFELVGSRSWPPPALEAVA